MIGDLNVFGLEFSTNYNNSYINTNISISINKLDFGPGITNQL